jgi:hypothetical protein
MGDRGHDKLRLLVHRSVYDMTDTIDMLACDQRGQMRDVVSGRQWRLDENKIEVSSRGSSLLQQGRRYHAAGVDGNENPPQPGDHLLEHFKTFAGDQALLYRDAGDIRAWATWSLDESDMIRVFGHAKDDRHRRCFSFGSQGGCRRARPDDIHLFSHQLPDSVAELPGLCPLTNQ